MTPDAEPSGMSAATLEDEEEEVVVPTHRMLIAVVALVGLLVASYMSLYKLGVLGRIVCGSGGCETVQNSPWSVMFGVPVPYLGFVGYAAMLGASLIGIQPGFLDDRRISAALLSMGTVAFSFSLYLSWLEANVIHAWCRWCIGSAIVATLLFLLSLAELPRLIKGGRV